MAFLARLLASLPLLIVSPLLVVLSAAALAVMDAFWLVFGARGGRPAGGPAADQGVRPTATVVIPNWNGRDLLARYLPYLETALAGNDANEILVVDNGSTDGSAEFVRTESSARDTAGA